MRVRAKDPLPPPTHTETSHEIALVNLHVEERGEPLGQILAVGAGTLAQEVLVQLVPLLVVVPGRRERQGQGWGCCKNGSDNGGLGGGAQDGGRADGAYSTSRSPSPSPLPWLATRSAQGGVAGWRAGASE